jgi:hypothetical protein
MMDTTMIKNRDKMQRHFMQNHYIIAEEGEFPRCLGSSIKFGCHSRQGNHHTTTKACITGTARQNQRDMRRELSDSAEIGDIEIDRLD